MFQHYLIVFIDHLGQKRALRQMINLPTSEDEKQEFIGQIKQTLGKVDALRGWFKEYFDGVNSCRPNAELVRPELRKEFAASQKSEAYFYGLSDFVIIGVPLMNDDDNCTAINGVCSAFVATCCMGLLSLSAGIIIRGGLDVGIATQIKQQEIYGPAVERAYYIERQLAEYPRFVVGNELINYILSVENQQCSSLIGQSAKEIATMCRNMIIQDSDGRYMLDFLGVGVQKAVGELIDRDIVKKAFDFVKCQYEQFARNNDDKLASRYYRLLRYFRSKLSV